MTERRVRFTATATRHIDRERSWWFENRDQLGLFTNELERAAQILAILPSSGSPYHQTPVSGLRRLYLRKINCHLYYTFDDREVLVHAVWGSRRRRGPPIPGEEDHR